MKFIQSTITTVNFHQLGLNFKEFSMNGFLQKLMIYLIFLKIFLERLFAKTHDILDFFKRFLFKKIFIIKYVMGYCSKFQKWWKSVKCLTTILFFTATIYYFLIYSAIKSVVSQPLSTVTLTVFNIDLGYNSSLNRIEKKCSLHIDNKREFIYAQPSMLYTITRFIFVHIESEKSG